MRQILKETAFMALMAGLSLMVLSLVACGKGGGSDASASAVPVLSPGGPGAVAPNPPSVFAGYQFSKDAISGKPRTFCTLGTGYPKWTCNIFVTPPTCAGITLPDMVKIHADDSIDLWGSFESAIYNNGQYTLTGSGYSWQMAWMANNQQDVIAGIFVGYAVLSFSADCHELFVDAGSI